MSWHILNVFSCPSLHIHILKYFFHSSRAWNNDKKTMMTLLSCIMLFYQWLRSSLMICGGKLQVDVTRTLRWTCKSHYHWHYHFQICLAIMMWKNHTLEKSHASGIWILALQISHSNPSSRPPLVLKVWKPMKQPSTRISFQKLEAPARLDAFKLLWVWVSTQCS